jgi:hypothetical protein
MQAPYGVIFQNPNKVFVGMPHGRKPPLSKDLIDRINLIARADGAWYEGDGGDKEYFDTPYKGSWDHKFIKSIKGYPIEFLSAMFGNVKENHIVNRVTDSSKTIFQAILDSDVNYFNDRDIEDATLTKFLAEMDMLEKSKKPATERNTRAFFEEGEDKTWGGPEPHRFAQSAVRWRDKFLLAQPDGAYFVGAGHLPSLKKLHPSLRMIGGEKAE